MASERMHQTLVLKRVASQRILKQAQAAPQQFPFWPDRLAATVNLTAGHWLIHHDEFWKLDGLGLAYRLLVIHVRVTG
jgi:hypothetical protein